MDRIDKIFRIRKFTGRRGSLFVLFILSILSVVFAVAQEPWKKALPGYSFDFKRDHASHPDYKIEWWYYTGNLTTRDNRRFGYQLTFFRVGVNKQPANPSRWAVRDLFMTHLAVTDINGNRFRHSEKLNRAGIGWAGAATDVYRVWNEDWEAKHAANGNTLLRAVENGFGVELELEPGKAPTLHGAGGLSQKGGQPGNASFYYSQTRMPSRGVIVLDGERYEVTGQSWMDHEFGTSFLEKGQTGWNWFALQLDDGTDLMLYQFRRDDQQGDPHNNGTLVDVSGNTMSLRSDEFTLEPGATWRSNETGAEYPIEWRVRIPSRKLELTVKAAIANQELRTQNSAGVHYWEGAVEISGIRDGRPIRGKGYLEMTGYAGDSLGVVLE